MAMINIAMTAGSKAMNCVGVMISVSFQACAAKRSASLVLRALQHVGNVFLHIERRIIDQVLLYLWRQACNPLFQLPSVLLTPKITCHNRDYRLRDEVLNDADHD